LECKAGIIINSGSGRRAFFGAAGQFVDRRPSAGFGRFRADTFFSRNRLSMCSADAFVCQCNWIYRLEAWWFFTGCGRFLAAGTLMPSAALKSFHVLLPRNDRLIFPANSSFNNSISRHSIVLRGIFHISQF